MKFIRGLQNLNHSIEKSVVTIGNFDGVHLGHQALISAVVKQAKQRQVASVLMTFEPHPQEFFSQQSHVRLMRLRDKVACLRQLGIDYVVCVYFNSAFANITAQDFVSDILVKKLGMQALFVGEDFRFGAKRQGDIALLKQLASQYHYQVHTVPMVAVGQQRVSSTRVRQCLQAGDLEGAKLLLDRHYRLAGHVTYGDQRGRELGYPTANIAFKKYNVPMTGVFIVQAHGLADQPLPAVANFGTRPMFDGDHYLLETHIFDFNDSVYGQLIEVEFLQKIRDEMVFDSVEALVDKMRQDEGIARQYFKKKAP